MKIINYLGHTFCPGFFSSEVIAIDCGANHGGFARYLSENTNLTVHSFEADPRLFRSLPKLPRVTYCDNAVTGKSGPFEIGLGDSHCSSLVYREGPKQLVASIAGVSLDDYCGRNHIDSIDLLKMDIEGAELDVLELMSDRLLRGTKQITVEFHDFLRASDLPRIKQVVQRLKLTGFLFMKVSVYTWGDCLFLNKHHIQLGAFDRMRLALQGKYIPGISRQLERLKASR